MYDSIAILKSYGAPVYDEFGNEKISVIERQVFVQPRGVYRSEFYSAAQTGLKPSVTLFISSKAEYHGERLLTFEGRDFEVIRTDWSAQRDGISLICEEKIRVE